MSFLLIANAPTSLINFRLDLMQAIQAKGEDVHVACPDLPAGAPERLFLEGLGVNVHPLPLSRTGLNPMADLYCCFVLWRLMRRLKPQRVFSYTIKPVIWGSLAAALAGVPQRYALISGLGYAFVNSTLSSKKRQLVRYLAQRLYRLALNSCQEVFFQNTDDQALLRRWGVLKASTSSTRVKGSGVNLNHFVPTPLPAEPAFIMVARLLIDKGVRDYAQAAAHLKARYPTARFILVGPLDANPESIAQTELDQWIEQGYIDYLGALDDVRPAIAQASVFVLPTFYREGLPRTLLEALAMGRAIITTATPGCKETVTQGENGFLVTPQAVNELIAAMEQLLKHPERLPAMGAASLKKVKEGFDVDAVNAIMLEKMRL